MHAKISVSMDGSPFDHPGRELARVLRRLSTLVEDEQFESDYRVRTEDSMGYHCGQLTVCTDD